MYLHSSMNQYNKVIDHSPMGGELRDHFFIYGKKGGFVSLLFINQTAAVVCRGDLRCQVFLFSNFDC